MMAARNSRRLTAPWAGSRLGMIGPLRPGLRLLDAPEPVKLGAARHRRAREAASDAVGMA